MDVNQLQTVENKLLAEVAREANIANTDDLRWFHVGGESPRSIVIKTRGANSRTVKTISANNDLQAWRSWEPVLAELLAIRKQGSKRVNHKKLPVGKI